MRLTPAMMKHAPLRQPLSEAERKKRMRVLKRLVFILILAAQPLCYMVLTDARYEGQGLDTMYFRLATVSDLLSLSYGILASAFVLLAVIDPERIGFGRTISALVLTSILLWLDFGLQRIPPNDFLPEAGIGLILSMAGLLAVLSTRSRPDWSWIRRTLRIFRNALTFFLLVSLFAFGYGFFFPTYSGLQEITNFNSDAGVVLGAAVWRGSGLGERPSPTLSERIDVGYALLSKHAISRIVVTGGSAPGELSEAEVAKRDLLLRGVDPSQIIEETNSHTTLEQVRYLHDDLFLKQKWSRFVIISDQYHLARVVEMCHFNGLHAIGSPSRIHQPFLDLLYYRLRESIALVVYWLIGR